MKQLPSWVPSWRLPKPPVMGKGLIETFPRWYIQVGGLDYRTRAGLLIRVPGWEILFYGWRRLYGWCWCWYFTRLERSAP